jgi:hypothetical protein
MFGNGTFASVGMSAQNQVINNGNAILEFEKIQYSNTQPIPAYLLPYNAANEPIEIDPYTVKTISQNINYLPDETPPESITVPKSADPEIQYWLHVSEKGHYSNSGAVNKAGEQSTNNKKNATEIYVDSLMSISKYSDQMTKILHYFSPLKIMWENENANIVYIDRGSVSLKKIPLDSLLNFKKEFYEFDTYDLYHMPGKPALTDCYFDDENNKTIILNNVKLDPDIKDTKGTAFLINKSYDKHLTEAQVHIVVPEDKDTLADKTISVNTDIPPRTYQAVPFILDALKTNSFKKKDFFFNFQFELVDYTIR